MVEIKPINIFCMAYTMFSKYPKSKVHRRGKMLSDLHVCYHSFFFFLNLIPVMFYSLKMATNYLILFPPTGESSLSLLESILVSPVISLTERMQWGMMLYKFMIHAASIFTHFLLDFR